VLGLLISATIFIVTIALISYFVVKRFIWEDRAEKAKYARSDKPPIGKAPRTWLIIPTIILGFLFLIASFGITEVPAGSVGVITSFGRVNEGTLPSGLTYVVPVMNQVVIIDTRVQVYEFADIEGATSDTQAVRLSGTVNYRVDGVTAWRLYRDVGIDFATKIFNRPAETALKSIVPKYTAIQVISKREEIALAATAMLEPQVEQYGVSVEAFYVSNIGLNVAFLDSVEQKQIAQQETLRAQQLVEKAKQEANARIETAKGEAQSAIERARGEAEANRQISASLTDQVLLSRYIDKLSDNIQVMLVPAGQNTLLDLKSLISQKQ